MNFQLFKEQFPIVFDSLNAGFLQTMKLFTISLVGSIPLGLIISFGSMSKFKPLSLLVKTVVWVIRGTPLMIQLLIIYFFPGLVMKNNIWGSGEEGRFIAACVSSSLTTPAISPRYTGAAFRACPRVSRRRGKCSASQRAKFSSKSPSCR